MFEIALFVLVCVCALVIFVCRFVFSDISKREPEAWYLDYARSFFPVFLIVFVLRSFVAEPFRIPSGSMLPTLEIGDFILVNKFAYGIRLPVFQTKIIDVGDPQRGDIMVFRWPKDNKTSYIKRVIGLPGDIIEYRNTTLLVNGQQVQSDLVGDYIQFGESRAQDRFSQTLESQKDGGSVQFSTLLQKRSFNRFTRGQQWTVPEGHYFMMGDNRDDSSDSRRWGFMPEENIIGKAFFVWFHWNNSRSTRVKFSRIGTDIQAETVE